MEKYPVTSTRGNIYHVTVNDCRYYKHHFEIGIYHKYKGWFNKDRYQLLNEGFMGGLRSYDGTPYDFNITELVKVIINQMEDRWEEIENHNKLKESEYKKFEKWDGKL